MHQASQQGQLVAIANCAESMVLNVEPKLLEMALQEAQNEVCSQATDEHNSKPKRKVKVLMQTLRGQAKVSVYVDNSFHTNPNTTIRSHKLMEALTATQCGDSSYRLAVAELYHDIGVKISHRTANDLIRQTGEKIRTEKQAQQSKIFAENGFTDEGLPINEDDIKTRLHIPQSSPFLNTAQKIAIVKDVNLTELNRWANLASKPAGTKANKVKTISFEIEDPKESAPVYISIDEVGCKLQKFQHKPTANKHRRRSARKRPLTKHGRYVQSKKAQLRRAERHQKHAEFASKCTASFAEIRPTVNTTVVHLRWDNHTFRLIAPSVSEGCKELAAFLLHNNLLSRHLVFFTDGATVLHTYIEQYFGYSSHQINLDWYHAIKYILNQVSRALILPKDKKERVKLKIQSMLWFFDLSGLLKYLQELKRYSNAEREAGLDSAISYINRKRKLLPCYAVRKALGLPNSSNPVERSNDQIVALRQKHNASSWSQLGSNALAQIKCAQLNGQLSDALDPDYHVDWYQAA